MTSVKKTGYQDIDQILIDVHELLQEGERLQKEITEALKFNPKSPYSTTRKRMLKHFSFKRKANHW